MNIDQFKQSIKFFNKRHQEATNPIELWSENTERNLPRIKKKDSIWQLENLLKDEKEKAVVLIGASPCLKRDVEKLKALDDNFITIAANSALKFLLKNGFKPDYVIALDGDKTNLVGHLDCDNEDLTLITSNATAPEAIDVWKGKIIWSPYYSIHKHLKSKVRSRLGRTTPCGGNSITAAAVIAYTVFDARLIIFVGSEGCFDKRYYVDKPSVWEKSETMQFKATDSKGRERRTNIPLNLYTQWLEKMAIDLPECTLVDTSFGLLGVDKNSRIHVMGLSEVIQRVKHSFQKKKEINGGGWQAREQLRYNAAYQTGQYLATNGKRIWEQIFSLYDVSKIKTILDVGCGLGQGIAMCRNEGLEAYGIDIAGAAVKYWELANIAQFCQVASADKMPFEDNRFDFVLCTEVMEHIPKEGVSDVLREIYRVGNNSFLFTICMKPALHKMPYDGSEPHICIEKMDWWLGKIKEAGFQFLQPTLAQSQVSFSLIAMKGKKDDGTFMSCNDMLLQPKRKMQSIGSKSTFPSCDRLSQQGNNSLS